MQFGLIFVLDFELLRWNTGAFSMRFRDSDGGRIQYITADAQQRKLKGCRHEHASKCFRVNFYMQ